MTDSDRTKILTTVNRLFGKACQDLEFNSKDYKYKRMHTIYANCMLVLRENRQLEERIAELKRENETLTKKCDPAPSQKDV